MSWQPGQDFALGSPRFRLRPLRESDLDEGFLAWWADPEIAAGLNQAPQRLTRARARAFVRNGDNQRRFTLGIFTRETRELIGVYFVKHDPRHRASELNVVIGDKAYWGQGTVLETRRVLIAFLFRYLGAEKVYGRPSARNVASVFNYKAQGFRCEGILKAQLASPDGGRLDQYIFGLTRAEWQQQRDKERGDGA